MFEELKMRLAKRREAKRLVRLFADAGSSLKSGELKKMIRDKEVIVIEKEKKLHGAFVYITIGMAGVLSFLFIRKLAVRRDLRGRGFGSVLLAKIKDFSQRRQARGFLLFALEKARGFYEKNKLSGIWRFFWWVK